MAEELKSLKNKDLYAMLEIKENATLKEIKKAYRKKALKLHPDKNPDDSKAAALFHELSEALKILSDLGARAAYDHVRKAKKAASARTAQLDDKRKKVKLDLEAREKAANMREAESSKKVTRTLEQEIERLREEGSRILEEEQLAMKKLLREEAEERLNNLVSEPARLRVKWKITDAETDMYTKENLIKIFSKYGDVVELIVSNKKKKGSAIVEFGCSKEAELAHVTEIGFPENPLSVAWLSGQPVDKSEYAQQFAKKLGLHTENAANKKTFYKTDDKIKNMHEESPIDNDDFESQVFERMRKMQEMKRKQQEEEKT